LSYRLHPGAANDLAEAARFYRRNGGKSLSARFLKEFERVMSLIEANPKIAAFVENERRSFRIYGFP